MISWIKNLLKPILRSSVLFSLKRNGMQLIPHLPTFRITGNVRPNSWIPLVTKCTTCSMSDIRMKTGIQIQEQTESSLFSIKTLIENGLSRLAKWHKTAWFFRESVPYYVYELRSPLSISTIWKHRIRHLGGLLGFMPWPLRRIRICRGHFPSTKREHLTYGVLHKRGITPPFFIVSSFSIVRLIEKGQAQLAKCTLNPHNPWKWCIVREFKRMDSNGNGCWRTQKTPWIIQGRIGSPVRSNSDGKWNAQSTTENSKGGINPPLFLDHHSQ